MTLAEEGHGLVLIGTGIGMPTQMSIAGVEFAKRCSSRFLEGYTSLMTNDGVQELEKMVGGIEILRRADVENPQMLLKLAKNEIVALLVVGDPLQATTHVDLLLRCHDQNIPTDVIHASSVTTFVSGGLGLQNYRFGRQVTLAFPVGDYLPTSPFEMLCESHFLGNHTLLLFDLDPTGEGNSEPLPMSPEQAVLILELMAAKLRDDPPSYLSEEGLEEGDVRGALKIQSVQSRLAVPVREWYGILCTDLGSEKQRIRRGSLNEISQLSGGRIHCLVIPSDLQGLEAEAMEKMIPPA